MSLDNIKRMAQPFADLGMKVGSDHTYCPTGAHKNKTASCKQSEDGVILWYCHRCDIGGTIVDAIAANQDLSAPEAIEVLERTWGSGEGASHPPTPHVRPSPPPEPPTLPPSEWIELPPPPSEPIHIREASATLDPADAKIWYAPHKSGATEVVSAVLRWDIGGKKYVRQMHFTSGQWHRSKYKSQPIYKMAEIHNSPPDTLIVVVEGEKCMDALQRALTAPAKGGSDYDAPAASGVPRVIVTTNLGGSGGARSSGFAVIGDRPVVLLPDNDAPGEKWASDLCTMLPQALVVRPFAAKDKGYDIADHLEEGGRIDPDWFPQKTDIFDQARSIPKEGVMAFLERLHKHGLDPIQEGEILNIIKERTGISMADLRKGLKVIEVKFAQDLPMLMAQLTVKEKFDNHLLYFGKVYYHYTGTHWTIIDSEDVKNAILDTIKRHATPDKDVETVLRKAYYMIGPLVYGGEELVQSLEPPKPIINTLSGEIHINPSDGSYELKPHNPESYLRHCLDVEFDPSATAPLWNKAVDEIFSGDTDLIRHFHEVVGYVIQPDRRFKTFFVCYGRKGNNGKTSLFHTVAKLCGAVSMARMSEFGKSRYDTANLVGKLMQLDDDLDKDTKLSDGLIKQLTEGKPLNVEYKYKDTVQIFLYAVVVMLCNHLPITTDLTHAMKRRAMIIPFNRSFSIEEVDKDLFPAIRANELSGILNLALAGVSRLFSRGRWDTPEACEAAKEEWLRSTSTLYDFVRGQLLECEGAKANAASIREAYEEWCAREGLDRKYWVSNRRMKQSLLDLGMKISETDGGWWYLADHKVRRHVDPVEGWLDEFTLADGEGPGTPVLDLYELYRKDTGDEISAKAFAMRLAELGVDRYRRTVDGQKSTFAKVWLKSH